MSIFGVVGGRLGAITLGAELGAFAGAFTIGLASNLYARWQHRHPAIVLVPSLLLLVPVSAGFLDLPFMEGPALARIEAAFRMTLTAVALASGLLIAGLFVPEPHLRRAAEH